MPSGSPLEAWTNPSLHLNSSTWNSRNPWSSFQNLLKIFLCSPYICDAASRPLNPCPPFHSTQGPPHGTLTVPKAEAFNWFPWETKSKHFVVFWVFNWSLGGRCRGTWHMAHSLPPPPCHPCFPLCPSWRVTAHPGNSHPHPHSGHLKIWASAPRDFLKNILFVNRDVWLKWALQTAVFSTYLPSLLKRPEVTIRDVWWHLYLWLTWTPLHSSQGIQQGFLWLAPFSVGRGRSVVSSPSDTPPSFSGRGSSMLAKALGRSHRLWEYLLVEVSSNRVSLVF